VKTILVCGSREWRDAGAVRLVLLCEPNRRGWEGSDQPFRVIHGGCRGADRIADGAARELGYVVQEFPADWARGKRAGPERNARMLDEHPDLVIAFGRGRGTDGTVAMAEARGIPVLRIGA
jgi:hypothetical protein